MEFRNVPFSPPDITEAEIKEVAEALRSGWITTGPRTKLLEQKLSEYCGTNKAVCLNSATASEELNLRVLGIKEGDEVIVPSYTYTSTAAAAIHAGAKVVFADCCKDSPEIDYERIESLLSEKTKAIIAVDLAGIICDYDKLFSVAENSKSKFTPESNVQEALGRIAVVSDAAHALGAKKCGKMAGSIADFTSFSFHAVKNFTTAEGGAATWRSLNGIDDEELYKLYQLLSLHGQSKDALAKTQLGSWEYDIVGTWYKYNMTDIMAAIGLAQFERYPDLLSRRKEIISAYDEVCDSLGVYHLIHYGDDFSSSGHLYITRIPDADTEIRNKIIIRMAEMGVACNVHYKPLPMMTAYRDLGWNIDNFPNSYNFFANEITLPLHTKLSDEDVEYVINCFKEAVNACR